MIDFHFQITIVKDHVFYNSGNPMLVPERNAEKLNALINDPSIYSWVSGDCGEPLDINILFENKENVFFWEELGGCCFLKVGDGAYDLHSFVLSAGRGFWMKKMATEALEWMFSNTDAMQIVTLCPRNNMAAIGAARALRFKKHGTADALWKQDGKEYIMDLYVLQKEVFEVRKCQ